MTMDESDEIFDQEVLSTREYLDEHVMPQLLPALEALLKEAEKPSSSEFPLNPLHWLASYLIRNNT